MSNDSPKSDQHDVEALHIGLLKADDHKIRRIVAVVDSVSDPSVNPALLDPLRPRLALLNAARPLRFARLLFIPLDPLTVPTRAWRPGGPTIPRSILGPIARLVRTGLGSVGPYIDKIITGAKTDSTQAIARAGEALWPRAAEILDKAPAPVDWPETGLPLATYQPLSASIAAVFRRAPLLLSLARGEEIGALEADDASVEDILRNIENESDAGCAMIARLILLRSPRAARVLWRMIASGRGQDEKTVMEQAMGRGMEAVLTQMERETGFTDGIGHGALADVSGEVGRVATFLREIETDASFANEWPRVRAIREKLDEACRERFARGINEGLLRPLASVSGQMQGAAQTVLETCARDLRKLDAAGRKVGRPDTYDRLLREALEAVRVATEAGTLTLMRRCRLTEILAGSEAAEILYNKAQAEL